MDHRLLKTMFRLLDKATLRFDYSVTLNDESKTGLYIAKDPEKELRYSAIAYEGSEVLFSVTAKTITLLFAAFAKEQKKKLTGKGKSK